jgi:hypothetical protein
MNTYLVRVTLGESWCFEIGDDLEVHHVDRLADLEPAAHSWITEHDGGAPFQLQMTFLRTHH